ncbi:MAG: YwiC-like family protein [Ignavibacteriaceae bacterium]|nr:YwiC-like family protein [Ignavibacteriaceae bacterium]
MKIGKQTLIVTNEHGSWIVLFVPMLIGILSTKNLSIAILPLFFLVLFSFMLYKPAELIFYEWVAGRRKSQKYQTALVSFFYYGFFAAGFLVYEILFLQKYLLLGFGAVAVIIFLISVNVRSSGILSFLREFLGIVILTSTAPIAVYCLENRITDFAVTLWILNSLFFFSGTCYVNLLIDRLSETKGKSMNERKISSKNIHFVYHLALSFFLISFVIVFPNQYFKALAFIPMVVHAFTAYFSGRIVKDFKKVGLTLLGYSLFFALFISIP